MISPRTAAVIAAGAALASALGAASPAAAAPREASFRAAPVVSFETGSEPSSVAIGDFDGDGTQDLAVADYARARVHVRLGNGDGTFRERDVITALEAPRSVVAGDFNGDGTEDLAVAARSAPDKAVTVLIGQGTGKFTRSTSFSLPGGSARSLATGDFNGDGRTDLVGAAAQHVSVRLLAQDGSVSGGGDMSLGTGPANPQSVATGDFDGNGTEDVVITAYGQEPGGKTMFVLPGNGDGGFGPPTAAGMPGLSPAVAVGDVDADARQDVVAPLHQRNTVSVKLGDGRGTLPSAGGPPEVPVGDIPVAIALADFDGDGLEDFVAANSKDSSLSVRLGDGTGGFEGGAELPVGGIALSVAVGDFDADGRADIASPNGTAGTVSVWLGAGEAPLAGNLLENGGFEEGPGAGSGDYQPVPIPGWTVTGRPTILRYGATPIIGFPTRLDAPRYQNGGSNFLWGGRSGADGITTATQVVDVGGSAAAIDGGRASVRLSAWLGGARTYPDRMTATATFVDAGGVAKGSLPVLPSDEGRHGLTTLMRRTGAADVPPGTRRIEVTLTSIDTDTVSSAMADNVKLELETRPGGDEPGPGPGGAPDPGGQPGPDGGPGGGGPGGDRPGGDRTAPVIRRVRVAAARRRTKIRYRLSEKAAVTVRIERVAKKRRRVAVGTLRRAGKAGGNRLAFRRRIGRKALRRGAYRLVITAVDAAGNRSAARTRRFRIA